MNLVTHVFHQLQSNEHAAKPGDSRWSKSRGQNSCFPHTHTHTHSYTHENTYLHGLLISLVAKCVASLTRSCWEFKKKIMFFPQKAGRSEQKTRELSVYSSVFTCFNPHHHWCSSPHLGSAACQFSWSCFHMWAVFLLFFSASWILCSFSLNLTLFSLLMFQPVMIGCDKRDISLHL